LVGIYKYDLSRDFPDELVQFSEFFRQSVSGEDKKDTCVPLAMLNNIFDNDLLEVFPNMAMCLRMYPSLLVSNCSGERSFSALKRIKTYLRSTLSDCKLNNLAILHIESDVLRDIDEEKLIDVFLARKERKKFD